MSVESQIEMTVNGRFEQPERVAGRNGNGRLDREVPELRVELLGGFRVQRDGDDSPISYWQRRKAKALTKLLATHPRHALHRDQILEFLWPDVELSSALNSFGKALYAARRALEPELLPRESSAYLRFDDSIVALDTEHVSIDADRFQLLAERALREEDVAGYESALSAYGGVLLPEDLYEDWCAERRDFLAELHILVLLSLADALEDRGEYSASADRLREALQHDPTREEIHRRLMFLYASAGTRDLAVRQFQVCQGALRRRLAVLPEDETVTLYQDILADRIERRIPALEAGREVESGRLPTTEGRQGAPFVGRDQVLQHLSEQLTLADDRRGRMILVSGEAGVGKTRLVAEFATDAGRRGASVLWGGNGTHANKLAYGPFAIALESYVASRPDAARDELAQLYPALAHFMPSLAMPKQTSSADRSGDDRLYLASDIVRLLTDLARARTVVLVLGDLHDLHSASFDLLEFLAQLAVQRRWLIIGTFREEGLEVGSELWRMIDSTMREHLCLHFELQRLARPDCDQLVRTMLPGARVGDGFLDHVYARSLGNPFFVEEVVREMREREELVLTNGSWETAGSLSARVPARVRAHVALRVASIDESARRVLALAAANGMEVSLADLRMGAERLEPTVSDAALFDALDRALELRILEERNDAYAFRHPLFRSALYDDLSQHRRDQLHAALGRSRTRRR
jgi:DNA-binding SARP family transcriptional activator